MCLSNHLIALILPRPPTPAVFDRRSLLFFSYSYSIIPFRGICSALYIAITYSGDLSIASALSCPSYLRFLCSLFLSMFLFRFWLVPFLSPIIHHPLSTRDLLPLLSPPSAVSSSYLRPHCLCSDRPRFPPPAQFFLVLLRSPYSHHSSCSFFFIPSLLIPNFH
ncbi:hypothetical protein C8J57DRAFT_1313512 [Mycena rebaudengoi]|nr:hypothetical protein C8J57DRAFT_1313512 [Mycena rebaudengoi]